jgi:hypothetical protein
VLSHPPPPIFTWLPDSNLHPAACGTSAWRERWAVEATAEVEKHGDRSEPLAADGGAGKVMLEQVERSRAERGSAAAAPKLNHRTPARRRLQSVWVYARWTHRVTLGRGASSSSSDDTSRLSHLE